MYEVYVDFTYTTYTATYTAQVADIHLVKVLVYVVWVKKSKYFFLLIVTIVSYGSVFLHCRFQHE